VESLTRQVTERSALDFRRVLSHFPTGMVAVTAFHHETVGMAIGSSCSISLDPPLVGFFVDRSSSTWPAIERAGSFAVNVLGEDQADLCRHFSRKGADRFAGVDWTPGRKGAPLIDDALAWIECEIADVVDVGDHRLVIGSVLDLDVHRRARPLIFFRGELTSLDAGVADGE